MPLTNTAIRNARLKQKPYKLFDERGLYLLVNAAGKYFRFDYRFAGKRKTLAIGVYPDVSLADARDRRDRARKLLSDAIDPGAQRKAMRASNAHRTTNSFEVVAREWFAKFSPNWAASHADKIIRRLERDVFPWIGARPVAEVTAPELLTVLRRIENRGALDTAHRALHNCSQVFRYAIATTRAERDPSGDLRGALPPTKDTHYAAIISPKQIGELLRAIDGYRGSIVTKCALRLAPLVFVRPGELRKAEWAEFNFEQAEWNIPAERMKLREPHLVPLSEQALASLRELYPLTGSERYVFPGARTNGRPMSDNAILAALRRMGYSKDEMTGHGFRAMARTILDEVLHVRPDYIEHQLAHQVKDPHGRAYNRTAHLDERRLMMQKWANYLDELKAGAEVIPLRA
jgi:integrase